MICKLYLVYCFFEKVIYSTNNENNLLFEDLLLNIEFKIISLKYRLKVLSFVKIKDHLTNVVDKRKLIVKFMIIQALF